MVTVNQMTRLVSLALGLLILPIGALAKTVTYYYVDPQGSTLATTDSAATVTTSSDYRSFGQAIGGVTEKPAYTGHFDDGDTGLLYMKARFYDPDVGRFLSRDPAVVAAGDIDSVNRFAYVGNNPWSRTDPTGMYICKGNPEQCETVAIAVVEIKQAANSLAQGSVAQALLTKVSDFYGAEGVDNKVTVTFGATEKGAAAQTATDYNKHNVEITMGDSAMFNLGKAKPVEIAALLAHEGTHGMRGKAPGSHAAKTREEEKDGERAAYYNQGLVSMGLGVSDNYYNLWKPGAADVNATEVENWAEKSATIWCGTRNPCN